MKKGGELSPEQCLRMMGGNPFARVDVTGAVQPKRKMTDSDRERIQGIKDRLARRILFPSAFNINVASDLKFLIELLEG